MKKTRFFCLSLTLLLSASACCQNLVTYAAGGEQVFNDVMELSSGDLLVVGSAKSLAYYQASLPAQEVIALPNPGITHSGTSGDIPLILQLNSTATVIHRVLYLPANSALNFRFIKTNGQAGQTTQNLYLSGQTSAGYFIAKLNNNFINGIPSALEWVFNVPATGDIRTGQPWDVSSEGKVVFSRGDPHSTSWVEVGRLNTSGQREPVPRWTNHWPLAGGEFYGMAADYPGGGGFPAGVAGINYSGIVFKKDPRCNLRSTTAADFDTWSSDGNGGTKKGKWPMDAFFNSPCTPGTGPTTGPGYTGYSLPSGTITYHSSAIVVDRTNGNMYIGFNNKSVLPDGLPDFEPAVLAMNADGDLLWWSRLYHEKRADGTLQLSTPDQYVDALQIDYASGRLVVVARSHGNNVENLWEGNTVNALPLANGFQNRFTGTSGNIHVQWIGKLSLTDGTFLGSTYMGEYAEGASGLGSPHPDPNLDGFPDPNAGWATLNTTRVVANTAKVTPTGEVLVIALGRRTITTANAFQKMPLPSSGLVSTWNHFVRLYNADLSVPVYSSLLTGDWNKTTGSGGDNVTLRGVIKTASGFVVVGFHRGTGNEMPLSAVPGWGQATYNVGDTTAVLAYLRPSSTTLPLQLVSYHLSVPENCKLDIHWQTADEVNTSHFEIEAGDDGHSFRSIGRVEAQGNGNGRSYRFATVQAAGNAFYRLKMVDLDGTFTYSPVRWIRQSCQVGDKVTIWPNPVSSAGMLHVNLTTSYSGNALLQVTSADGRIVIARPITLAAGPNSLTLALDDLPVGIYALQVTSLHGRRIGQVQKLIVNR